MRFCLKETGANDKMFILKVCFSAAHCGEGEVHVIRLIEGPAASGKSGYVFSRIAGLCENESRSILIVPESDSHRAERRLLTTCGNGAGRYAEVTTFSKLTRDILAAAGRSVTAVDAGQALFMYKAIRAASSGLKYFRRAAGPRLVESMLETVKELEACRITPARLAAAAESGDMPKIHDIGMIYAAYIAEVQRAGLDSSPFETACACLEISGIFAGAHVFIDGFSGFTAARLEAIRRMALAAGEVEITLCVGADEALFTQQIHTRQRLKDMANANGITFGTRRMESGSAMEAFAAAVFDFSAEAEAPGEVGIDVVAAESPQEECELVASLVRSLTVGGNARLRDVAVVCQGLDEYAGFLEYAFARYDMPLFLSRREDILKKPVAAAVTGAVEVIESGLRCERVLKYIKLGLCGLTRDESETLENYALMWNISGKKWLEPFMLSTAGYGSDTPDEDERLAELERMRRAVMGPIGALKERLKLCRAGADFARALREYLDTIAYEEQLKARIARLTHGGMARLAGEYAQVYDIINGAVEQVVLVCGDDEMNTGEFLELLRLVIGQYDVDVIPASLDAVQASTCDRFFGGEMRHIFILGAREGMLPMGAGSGGLIAERERIALETDGIVLTQTAEERAFEEQSYIYRVIASAAETLCVTWPRASIGGEECRRGMVADRIAELTSRNAEAADMLRPLRLTARAPAFELACAAAQGEDNAASRAALEYFSHGTDGARLAALRAYAGAPRGPIGSRELVEKLYGGVISMTASRVERIASCRFSYFMQYGLRAKPRRKADFGAPEIGSFVHEVIEKSVRQMTEIKGLVLESVVRRCADEYLDKRLRGRQRTARFEAIFGRLTSSVIAITDNICQEIAGSDFKPLFYELEFGGDGGLPPVSIDVPGGEARVQGKIDRVDGYVKDGVLYFKVVDYKTGSKAFRLSDLLYGLNMQLFVYAMMMDKNGKAAALERAGALFEVEAADTATAAALYIPAKNPFVQIDGGETGSDIRDRLDRELRRIGIVSSEHKMLEALEKTKDGIFRFLPVAVNRDGSLSAYSSAASGARIGRLVKHAELQVAAMAGLIASGDIEANPYRTGATFEACDWCDYRAACHFDPGLKRDTLRFLPSLKQDEVFALLEKEGE